MRRIRLSVRGLTRRPAFTVFSVVTLALAIGSLSAIFAVADAVLLQPPGIRAPDEVVLVYHGPPVERATHEYAMSWPDARDLVTLVPELGDTMLWTFFRSPLTGEGQFDLVAGEAVSGNYFPFTGAALVSGRPLHPADDAAGAPPVAVVSGTLAARLTQRGPILGRTITLGGTPFEIVGIVSPGFRGVDKPALLPTLVWVPLSSAHLVGASRPPASWQDRNRRWLRVAARLLPGEDVRAVRRSLDALSERLDAASPIGRGRQSSRSPVNMRRFTAIPVAERYAHESVDFFAVPVATGVLVAAGLVLLVAITNLATLLLAHGADRRHELAVRRALGASRWRLLQDAAADGIVLTVLGGVGGVLVALILLRALPAELPVVTGVAIAVDAGITPGAAAVAGAATLTALLLFAVIPAWQTTRAALRGTIDERHGAPMSRWPERRLSIAAQIAVSVAVLVPAITLFRAGAARASIGPGFEIASLAAAQIEFRYRPDAREGAGVRLAQAAERLRAAPEIRSAAILDGLPIYLGQPTYLYVGQEPVAITAATARSLMQAGRVASGLTGTAEMLDALGIDLRQGRFFTPAEAESGAPVTVVSETLATRLFDSAAVVGRTMYIGAEPRTIIGVAADTDSISVGTRDYGTAYLPGMPDPRRSIVIVARSHTTGAAALRILQSTLRDLDPDLPVVEMVTGPQIIARQTMFERTAGALGGVLGYFALVLALAGASGLLSFTVASRRREIGIRRALGALNRHIVRLLALRMVVSVVAGALAGLVAGLMVAFLIGYVLNREVSVMPLDVTVVAGSLLAATLLAALMPLRRALRVDPATCLRD